MGASSACNAVEIIRAIGDKKWTKITMNHHLERGPPAVQYHISDSGQAGAHRVRSGASVARFWVDFIQ
jgi:hypothetical protein